MKIKSLLAGMLATTAFVACTNDVETAENNGAIQAGEKSYVAVNIVAPTASRAASDFVPGSAGEVAVNKAVFLFLNENFEGCADPCEVVSPDFSKDATGEGLDKEATILVLKNAKQVPAYMVAVLNPVATYTDETDLSDLQDEVAAYTTKTNENFVMSNAVYKGADGREVAATPITMDNIFGSEDEAKAAPVTIQVERVVAKVAVELDDAEWEGQEEFDGCETKELDLVIDGWDILQNNNSYLVKKINLSWTHTWWNSTNLKRSYWAVDYADGGRNSLEVKTMNLPKDGYRYVEETVSQTANTVESDDVNPYLVVAAHFVEAGTENPVSLVEWRGRKYTLNGYLNFIVTNSKIAQYWYKTADGYEKFNKGLLEMVEVETAWKNEAKLTNAAAGYEYYTCTYDAAGEPETGSWKKAETSDVEAAIAEFGEVQYWNGGKTYYYTPIKHQTVGTDNYYGVVRNHYYKIEISGINGYGTPVSNPDHVIEIPERPTDDESYLAAKVVILDWKVVVNDNVELN